MLYFPRTGTTGDSLAEPSPQSLRPSSYMPAPAHHYVGPPHRQVLVSVSSSVMGLKVRNLTAMWRSCHRQLCGQPREFCPSSTVESVGLVTPVRGTLRRISSHFQLWILLCSFICPSVHLSVHPPMHPFIHESMHPRTHPSPIPPFILPPSTHLSATHPFIILLSMVSPIHLSIHLSTHPSILFFVLRLRSKIIHTLGEGRDQP